ncbi:MAG: response regulator [Proteobacteria bacterium]|nr:response regulator [Pseudomonadota bacterium]
MDILIVDDSRDFLVLIEAILSRAGYTSVLSADSAEVALGMLGVGVEQGPANAPDLILMDINMGGIDGVEATRRIKAVPALYDIPIIMLTAHSDKSLLDAAFKAGANDYIVKPPDRVELLARVRAALNLKTEIDGRKRAANELRKLSYVVEQNPAPIMIVDTDRRIEYVNWAFTESLGYLADDILGSGVEVLNSECHPEEFYRNIWDGLESGRAWRGDICVKSRNGKNIWQLQRIIPIRSVDGHISHFVTVKIDDTERRLAEEALKEREVKLELLSSELHELTLEMSNLEERERKSFAEMLHEDIGQNLATMQLTLANRLSDTASDSECSAEAKMARKEFFELFGTLLGSTIRATRTLTSEIYPAVPYGTGMADAARWYGNIFLKQSGTELAVELDPGFDSLGERIKESLLRVVRESLQNIMKHAGASSVAVTGSIDGNGLELSVTDNGRGFSLEGIRGKKGRGIGTLLMRERIKELGGSMEIASTPGSGTTVTVRLDVSAPEGVDS